MSDIIANINNNYIGGDILDSQWVNAGGAVLFSVVSYPALSDSNSLKTISLEDLLPNDGHAYLCLISMCIMTGTSSNNRFQFDIYSGTVTYAQLNASSGSEAVSNTSIPGVLWLPGVITRASSAQIAAGWAYVPIYPEDRNITFINLFQKGNTTYTNSASLLKFRRLGTNI